MTELILHHYDISPYAEKIRLAFGLKGLAWASVIVPATLPKPDLMPLTGGFRRTPVLQIGADIYCDTLRIAMELDQRCPEPRLLPESGGGAGFDGILATWAERVLMWPTARYVTGMNRDALPEAFFRDRAEMRGHPVPTPDEVAAGLPHEEGQLGLMLGWVEDLLADDRRFARRAAAPARGPRPLPAAVVVAGARRPGGACPRRLPADPGLDGPHRGRRARGALGASRRATPFASHRPRSRPTRPAASGAMTLCRGAESASRPRTSRGTRWKASSSTPPGRRSPYGATTPKSAACTSISRASATR